MLQMSKYFSSDVFLKGATICWKYNSPYKHHMEEHISSKKQNYNTIVYLPVLDFGDI